MSLPPDDEQARRELRPKPAVEPTVDFQPDSGAPPNLSGETNIVPRQEETDHGIERQEHEAPQSMPRSFGKYQVREVLGRGAYGAVFLGYDPQLDRQAAIKVPLIN